jgi:hypothetical protein
MESRQITLLNISQIELVQIVEAAVASALNNINDRSSQEKTLWLTRKEAGRHLQLSLPTLDKLTRLSLIPAHRTGRKKLYNLDELNVAIKNLKVKYK